MATFKNSTTPHTRWRVEFVALEMPEDRIKTIDQPADSKPAKQNPPAWKPGKLWLAAIIGMGVGVLAGSAYLLSGGEYIVNIPRWASVVFFTGFAAGNQAANSGMGEGAAKIVGVAAVGLTYAAIAVLIYLVWHLVKRKEIEP